MQDYSLIKLFYNDSEVKQINRVNRVLNANNQPMMLMNEGLGGFSPGSAECTIEWECPIPIGGTEYDYEGDEMSGAYVKLQMFVGRRSYAGLGKIQTTTTEGSSGSPSSINISWQGEAKPTA
jgi:hypothetical protein